MFHSLVLGIGRVNHGQIKTSQDISADCSVQFIVFLSAAKINHATKKTRIISEHLRSAISAQTMNKQKTNSVTRGMNKIEISRLLASISCQNDFIWLSCCCIWAIDLQTPLILSQSVCSGGRDMEVASKTFLVLCHSSDNNQTSFGSCSVVLFESIGKWPTRLIHGLKTVWLLYIIGTVVRTTLGVYVTN